MWLWTCRPGFEPELRLELERAGCRPEAAGASLLRSAERPASWPVFARAGFPVMAELPPRAEELAAPLAEALRAAGGGRCRAWLLLAWVPDADATNPLSSRLDALAAALLAELERSEPEVALLRADRPGETIRRGGLLGQLCLADAERALVGALPALDSPTLAPGGRARSRAPRNAPSRAARKLAEAFDWIGRGPEAGELCVDLGAAPGGWTAVLLSRRARVIAVDPARLAPDLASQRGLVHERRSAYDFAPREPADWLFCDMAQRPLDVARLLAKWGRRRWASTLVANLKLPMKQRVRFVEEILATVADGGWQELRGRQLYHDREEFTLSGWR